jgi:hypothetical protein
VRPVVPSEGLTLPRIAVDCRVWLAGKRRLDLSLCSPGDKLILLGQMHQERRIKAVDLAQILLGVTAVIGNGYINVAAHGRQERHQGR